MSTTFALQSSDLINKQLPNHENITISYLAFERRKYKLSHETKQLHLDINTHVNVAFKTKALKSLKISVRHTKLVHILPHDSKFKIQSDDHYMNLYIPRHIESLNLNIEGQILEMSTYFPSLESFITRLNFVSYISFGNLSALKHLELHENTFPIAVLPANLKFLYLPAYNVSLPKLPDQLQTLKMWKYILPLPNLPTNLEVLELGKYNLPLTSLPAGLKRLEMDSYNRPLPILPSGLTHLTLNLFDQPIKKQLPASLIHIDMENYKQEWNCNCSLLQLEYLRLNYFVCDMCVVFAPNLKSLHVDHCLSYHSLFPKLETLNVNKCMQDIHIPNTIKEMNVKGFSMIERIPLTVEKLRLSFKCCDNCKLDLSKFSNLKELKVCSMTCHVNLPENVTLFEMNYQKIDISQYREATKIHFV